MVIINEQRKEKKRESFFFSSHSFSIILRLDALRLSTMTMMNENFIKPNHALIVRWEDQLVRTYLSISLFRSLSVFRKRKLRRRRRRRKGKELFNYALAISSSNIWLSRCNLISMVGKSFWSIRWPFKCAATFAEFIIIIKYSWDSCSIGYILSSFNWHTWHALYSSTNRYFEFLNRIRVPLFSLYSEAVTFLGNQERDRNLYAIPGLDYVAHEDVIPYTVINKLISWLEL